MPGPVSDSFDPEFGTGSNAHDVATAIREVVDLVTEKLGPDLKPIIQVAQGTQGTAFQMLLTERQLRLIRFGLMRALESI